MHVTKGWIEHHFNFFRDEMKWLLSQTTNHVPSLLKLASKQPDGDVFRQLLSNVVDVEIASKIALFCARRCEAAMLEKGITPNDIFLNGIRLIEDGLTHSHLFTYATIYPHIRATIKLGETEQGMGDYYYTLAYGLSCTCSSTLASDLSRCIRYLQDMERGKADTLSDIFEFIVENELIK